MMQDRDFFIHNNDLLAPHHLNYYRATYIEINPNIVFMYHKKLNIASNFYYWLVHRTVCRHTRSVLNGSLVNRL